MLCFLPMVLEDTLMANVLGPSRKIKCPCPHEHKQFWNGLKSSWIWKHFHVERRLAFLSGFAYLIRSTQWLLQTLSQ